MCSSDLLPARLVHDPEWLAALTMRTEGVVAVRAGGFGQVGLRDVRVVTHEDATPVVPDEGGVLLSATSAGVGFFDTAHTSIWHLDTDTLRVRHRGDLFVRRPSRAGRPGVFGDHATHVLLDRPGGEWLVATSTWGDFRRAGPTARVGVTLARVPAQRQGTRPGGDPWHGRMVLDAAPLDLPRPAASVGVWDPHLVRGGEGWLVGFVSATRWFEFHPALAEGPDLGRLALRADAVGRRATEGTTLHRDAEGAWWVLASDGPDSRHGARRYPVFDLDLVERYTLEAPYPTNIPWPTLVEGGPGATTLLVTFDGTPQGGRVAGYGTHGDLVILRSTEAGSPDRSTGA